MPTWETAGDWDAAQSETGTRHEQPANSGWGPADAVEKGYPSFDENGTNLVAYYTFNEQSGTTAYDVANGNDGTVSGASVGTAGGILGTSAYSFDGTDDEVTLPNLGISGDQSITINVWVENLDSRGYHNIYGQGTTGSTGAVCSIRFGDPGDNEAYRFYWWGIDLGVPESAVSTLPENFTNPFMVTAVYDAANSNRYVYQNANQVGSDSPSNASFDDNSYSIGGFNNEYVPADFSEVRIYDRALSQSEITDLYQAAL